ncbi:MAG TPA: c-type cytochrome [Terracidiphilus sp.]|jgi:mono/diheme cytochrome c family protein
MRLALAVVSLVVLAGSGVLVYRETQTSWQDHQKAYFTQVIAQAKTGAERSSLAAQSPKIEQTIVTAFGETRVDRCESCHIASDDPRFENGKEPLKAHPYSAALGDVYKDGHWVRRHKFSQFGCTACHDGQGRGLTVADAHGEDPFWPSPMLGYTTQADWKKENAAHLHGSEYAQANCAQCHTGKDFAGTAFVARGRELFFKEGCFGCHRIQGISSGAIGPDLTEVGKERKLDYLWGHIVDPRAYSPTSVMPQFKLSDDDKKALVIFLKSRRGDSPAASSVDQYMLEASALTPTPDSVSDVESAISAAKTPAARGEQLIQGYACLSCHKLDDHDGGVSPDLSHEGLIRDQAWLMAHFENPRSRIADSNMPAFGLPERDFQDMTAYLLTRTQPLSATTPAQTFQALCARCHGENGNGKGSNAIYLDPAPRDLTRAEFLSTKPQTRFIASIHYGAAGTSMPAWGKTLTDAQTQGVLDYVWAAFVKEKPRQIKPRKVPDIDPVAMSTASARRGQDIFLRRCTGCHGRKADGNGPNSIDISPRPRNLTNAPFVQSVSDHRLFESIEYGVDGTAMPSWMDYGLSQNDVGDIVNYIRNLNQRTQ